ncbi:glutaredoxin family protein [Candidatus Saccharibacteria bacterium]|nr:glutaredoxin family protein [Candidatus Saccharibacteria bacterium]
MSKITIYSTATCGYCKMLKSYLMSKDIKFTEKKADEDQKVAQELYEKSHQLGVPFTIIENDKGEEINVLGFDRPKIDQALSL